MGGLSRCPLLQKKKLLMQSVPQILLVILPAFWSNGEQWGCTASFLHKGGQLELMWEIALAAVLITWGEWEFWRGIWWWVVG